MRRARWKMIAGASVFGVLRILNDWNDLGGWSSVERAVFISSWIFCFWLMPLIALKLPGKHRHIGYLLFFCVVIQLVFFCACLLMGDHWKGWFWLAGSGLAGFGAFIFLLDQDVRRFRNE